MGNSMQDSSKQTLTFIVETAKLTEDIFLAVLQDYVNNKPQKTGKQTIGQLTGGHAEKLQNITITPKNLGAFKRVAAKYDINYAIKKDISDKDNPRYLIMFKGESLERIQKALVEMKFDKEKELSSRFSMDKVNEHEAINETRERKPIQRQRTKSLSKGELSH